MVRTLLAVVIAALAAVAFALWFQSLDGYVVAVFPPYRFQISSQLLVVLALLFLFVGSGLLRLLVRLLGTPRAVRQWRQRRHLEQAVAALEEAIIGWELGKPKQSFRALDRAYRLSIGTGAAAVAACEAALAVRDEGRAENALARIPETGRWRAVRQILEARFGLLFGRTDRLESALAALEKGGEVSPTVRERLRLEAGVHSERWDLALEAARKLWRHDALTASEFLAVAAKAYPALCAEALRRGQPFDAWWQGQPKEERQLPTVVAAVTETLVAHGDAARALEVARAFLRRRYAPEVLRAVVPLLPGDRGWLELLEQAIAEDDNDALLHEALLRVTLKLQLWGQAKRHYLRLVELDAARARAVAAEMVAVDPRELPWERGLLPAASGSDRTASPDTNQPNASLQPLAAEAAADTDPEGGREKGRA
ncbi:heme biosynthesis protein HemY [Hydrogenophilus islandicus]